MASCSPCTCCLFISLLLCCFVAVTQGEVATDCCLKVSIKQIPRTVVRGYIHQIRGQGCDIDAIIFITKKNVRLCAATTETWAINLMDHLDKQLQKCKEKKKQGKRCQQLKAA